MRRGMTAAVVLVVFGLTQVARADDGPTGTWSWQRLGAGLDRRGTKLKLKLEGDKLTGAVVDGESETAIEEASYKDGQVAFKVTLNFNGRKYTTRGGFKTAEG